jgi:hypothetical protein
VLLLELQVKTILTLILIGSVCTVAAPLALADQVSFPGADFFARVDFPGAGAAAHPPSAAFGVLTPDEGSIDHSTHLRFMHEVAIPGDGSLAFNGSGGSGFSGGTLNLGGTHDLPGGSGNETFSDPNTSVTPEPSSLILLGTGLLGGAGMLFRRRRA